MRITCVTMVRNEGAIIHEFASHLMTLFDDVLVVDHMSDDGTAGFLHRLAADDPRFHVIDLRNPGYFQSAAMTAVCAGSSVVASSDWVFFLDADEFLPFEGRSDLEAALSLYSDCAMIKLPWHNLVPVDYGAEGMLRRVFMQPKTPARHRKVAFQPKLMSVWPVIIDQGNHEILAFKDGGPLPAGDAFPMLHVPIRTFGQLETKLSNGLKSYRDMGAQWSEGLGTHWIAIEKALEAGQLTEPMANFVAARYGDLPEDQPWELSLQAMADAGYMETVLHGQLLGAADRLRERFWQGAEEASTSVASHWIEIDETTGSGRFFEAGEEAVPRSLGDIPPEPADTKFARLGGERPAPRRVRGSDDLVLGFLEDADRSIECMVPTSWGGHIPFMYALVELARPRRYVELGSHHGASFFAACQALNTLEGSREAVAIDLWEGDEHAGFYTEDVYRNFAHLLRTRFRNIGRMVRQRFSDAADRFEDGSIDLLHIDGLHTYEAVKEDYETWRPKVTENATIMFHDTNVYERGFGVWQFWDEVQSDGAAFNFKHTHGLGVLALGDENPVGDLIRLIHERNLGPFIEHHFAHIGRMSNEAAMYRDRLRVERDANGHPGGKRFYAKKKKPLPERIQREVSKGFRKVRGLFAGD